MLESSLINMRIQNNILSGSKIPHTVSKPVIYCEDNKYYLAVFVFFYNRENIQSGMIDRPTMWAIADIECGEIIRRYKCKNRDFSNADFQKQYNVRMERPYEISKDTFSILDSVRSVLIEKGEINMSVYRKYLRQLLVNVPEEYQRFYTDLSI